jgi:hypothetical protein
VRHGLARSVAVFDQRVAGVRVAGAAVSVTLARGEPVMIASTYVPGAAALAAGAAKGVPGGRPAAAIAVEDAVARVIDRLGAPEDAGLRTAPARAASATSLAVPPHLAAAIEGARLVFAPLPDGRVRLAHVVHLSLREPLGEWRGVVDAQTGEVLLLEDEAFYAAPRSARDVAPRAKNDSVSQTQRSFVDATGRVFAPSPVVTLQNLTLRDLADSEQTVFGPAYQTVTLRDVTQDGNLYRLIGPYVALADFEQPTIPVPAPNSPSFEFARDHVGFEAAMVYYHLDRAQRYLQELGYADILAFPVEVDAHGVNGADNSHFIPSTDQLAFGDGCVDDAEDADVIYHEYGHAIQDDQVEDWGVSGSGLLQTRSLGEGFGDYWASSVASQIGGGFDDAQVYDWDRGPADPCWSGRRVDGTLTLEDFGSDIYRNGSIWSSALWEIRGATGAGVADRLVIESHFGLPTNVTYAQNASSIALADGLLYSGTHMETIVAAFTKRGIEVDTTGFAPDTLSPGLAIHLLQNPVLSAYLDVLVLGSEGLNPGAIDGELNGAPLEFAQRDALGRLFRAEHRLVAGGAIAISVTAADFAGNTASMSRDLVARQVGGGASEAGAAIVSSHDGRLALAIPAGALPEGTWIVIAEPNERTDPSALAEYAIGPVGRALATPGEVRLRGLVPDAAGERAGLFLSIGDGAPPIALAGARDPETGDVVASLPALGVVAARAGLAAPPDVGAHSIAMGLPAPNPTTGVTRVLLSLARPQHVVIDVYDVAGARVATLLDRRIDAGEMRAEWDGRDARGRVAPSGVYLLRMAGEETTASRKVILAR